MIIIGGIILIISLICGIKVSIFVKIVWVEFRGIFNIDKFIKLSKVIIFIFNKEWSIYFFKVIL